MAKALIYKDNRENGTKVGGEMVELLHRTTGLGAFDEATQRGLARAVRRGIKNSPTARTVAQLLVRAEIEALCVEPLSTRQIATALGRKHTGYLIRHYLAPMVAAEKLVCIDGFYSTPAQARRMLP